MPLVIDVRRACFYAKARRRVYIEVREGDGGGPGSWQCELCLYSEEARGISASVHGDDVTVKGSREDAEWQITNLRRERNSFDLDVRITAGSRKKSPSIYHFVFQQFNLMLSTDTSTFDKQHTISCQQHVLNLHVLASLCSWGSSDSF